MTCRTAWAGEQYTTSHSVAMLGVPFMRTILPLLVASIVAGSCLAGAASRLPALKAQRWVNSAPLTPEGLRGKVVLVDVWEYTCINWIRTCRISGPGIAITRRSAWSWSGFTRQSSSLASAPRTSTVAFATMD